MDFLDDVKFAGVWMTSPDERAAGTQAQRVDGLTVLNDTHRPGAHHRWKPARTATAWRLAHAVNPDDIIAAAEVARHNIDKAQRAGGAAARRMWETAARSSLTGIAAGLRQLDRTSINYLGLDEVTWAWLDCYDMLARSAHRLGHPDLAAAAKRAVSIIIREKTRNAC